MYVDFFRILYILYLDVMLSFINVAAAAFMFVFFSHSGHRFY